jgi:hypothetical protein
MRRPAPLPAIHLKPTMPSTPRLVVSELCITQVMSSMFQIRNILSNLWRCTPSELRCLRALQNVGPVFFSESPNRLYPVHLPLSRRDLRMVPPAVAQHPVEDGTGPVGLKSTNQQGADGWGRGTRERLSTRQSRLQGPFHKRTKGVPEVLPKLLIGRMR